MSDKPLNLIISTEYCFFFLSGQDDDNGPIVQVQVNCVFMQTEVFRVQKIFWFSFIDG